MDVDGFELSTRCGPCRAHEETPDLAATCRRCPVMTILDAEFDDDFVGWMGWLAEQFEYQEAGLGIDTEQFETIDKKAFIILRRWVAEKREKAGQ